MYYYQEVNLVFGELRTSEEGLSSEDAEKRLIEYGKNELEEKEKTLFLDSFSHNLKVF